MERTSLKLLVLWILPILVAGSFLVMSNHPMMLFAGLIAVLVLAAWFIVCFERQAQFMMLFVFLLPFSVEIPIMGDHMMLFPSEPILIFAALMFGFELLRKPLPIPGFIMREALFILPMAAAFILTIPFSTMWVVSLKFSAVNLLYIVVFFGYVGVLSTRNPGLLRRLLMIYSTGFFLVAVWSVYQYAQYEWNPIVVRGIFSPFYKDHTIFGATAALLAIVWLAGGIAVQSIRPRIIALVLALVCISLVLMSGSRAAFVSLFFSLVVMLLLWFRIKMRYVLAGGAMLLLLLVFNQDHIVMRMKQIQTLSYDAHADLMDRTQSIGNITTDASNIERMNRWVAAGRMFLEKPLTGFGPGTYQFEYIAFQTPELKNHLTVTNPYDIPANSGGTAHSEYLLAMSEMGVLGLLGWIVLLGRWIFIAFRHNSKFPLRWQVFIGFSALSTYLFHALFNNFLNTDKFAFLFWGMAVWLMIHQSKDNERGLLSDR